MTDKQQNKLWGGRFSESTDQFVQEFTASVNFDQRMYRQDIFGSQAHATMLAEVGVLTEEERDAIINGLAEISTSSSGASAKMAPAVTEKPRSLAVFRSWMDSSSSSVIFFPSV